MVKNVKESSGKYSGLPEVTKELIRKQLDIEQNKISFIQDDNKRDEATKEYSNQLEEILYLLSKRCGVESLALLVPMNKGPGEELYSCGPKSMMALRTLMDDNYYDKIKDSGRLQWDFSQLPSADIFRVYVDCFHSLARESKSLI